MGGSRVSGVFWLIASAALLLLAGGCFSDTRDGEPGEGAGRDVGYTPPPVLPDAGAGADGGETRGGDVVLSDVAPETTTPLPDVPAPPPDIVTLPDIPTPMDVPLTLPDAVTETADAGGADTTAPPNAPLVNTTFEGRQWGAEVAALSGGGFVVSWMSSTPENDQVWAMARVYRGDGTPLSSEIAAHPEPGARQGMPGVTGLADGGFVLVWPVAMLGTPSEYALEGRVFSALGAPVGPVTLLSAFGLTSQRDVHLATLTNGDLVMAWGWDRYDGSSAGIVARILAPNLVPRGANFLPAAITHDAQSTPRVAALADGGFIVTWESTITAGYDVRARVFSAAGEPTTGEIAVNGTDTSGVQRGARPVALADGRVLVAYGDESYGARVRLRLVDPSDGEITWVDAVDGDLTWPGMPAVAADPDGATVFFQARPAEEEPLAIWRSDWSAAERTASAPELVYASAGVFHSAPEATALARGGQAVVWQCDDGQREGVCLATYSNGVEGPPNWDDLDCALFWESCTPLFPGCYFTEGCDEVPDCPISGCGTDGPAVEAVLFGLDACGVPWVELREPSGRLTTRPWRASAEGYGAPFEFDVLLDGEPTTHCSFAELPTGAIRYQLMCYEADGALAYAAVMEGEEAADGPACDDAGGCYRVEAPPILCNALLPCPAAPERARVEMGAGCSVTLRFEEEPALPFHGWLSRSGFLTFNLSGDMGGARCTLDFDGDDYGPAVCTTQGGSLALDLGLVRIADATCALPDCVLDSTCARSRAGDRCEGGVCTCDGGPTCGDGTVCAPESEADEACVPTALWDDPRACRTDADCQACLAGTDPVCCDQLVDGSALDAVNVFHPCPTCCTCSLSCEGVVAPSSVVCRSGRCGYRW